MEEFLRRIEATLGDSTIREEYNKADKEARMLSGKRKKLLEKYVDGGVNKEMYESLDEELQQKLSDVGFKVEYYRKLLGDRKNIQRRKGGMNKMSEQRHRFHIY